MSDGESTQAYDIIDAWELGFYEGRAVECLLSWKRNGGLDKLGRAIHYSGLAAARITVAGYRIQEVPAGWTDMVIRRPEGRHKMPLEEITAACSLSPLEADAMRALIAWRTPGELLTAPLALDRVLRQGVADQHEDIMREVARESESTRLGRLLEVALDGQHEDIVRAVREAHPLDGKEI